MDETDGISREKEDLIIVKEFYKSINNPKFLSLVNCAKTNRQRSL